MIYLDKHVWANSRDALGAPSAAQLPRKDLIGPFALVLAVDEPHDMTNAQAPELQVGLCTFR